MPDSTSNGQNDIGLESPALSVPATTHPFFMPLSVRRAQAAATIAVDTAGSGNAQQPRKKLKQKPVSTATAATGTKSDTEKRARKTKAAATTALAAATNGSTKIHSFFAVNSKKPAAAAQQPDSLSVECVEDVIASAISVAVDAPVAAAVAMDVDPLLYASEFNAWPSQKPKRPMFRPKGVPAPYPSDPSHVPLPSYSAFEPATRDGCSRFSVDAIDIAAIQDSLSNLACSNRHPSDSTDSGCGQWKHAIGSHMAATQQPLHGSHRGRPSYASIRAAPAQVLSGNISLPPIPPHLQFAAPFLNMLADPEAAVQSRINCSSQLLASRHRPKKASEVLDNKRAVLQLHSWIEGMRLKRPPPATISAQQLSVFKKPAAAAKPPKSSKSTAKPQKCRRRAAESEASDDNHDFFYSSDGGNSSDDFVPRTASSSRRRKAKNEFDDIFAWAQSDGTVSSVREHKRNNLKRHRRRVSYGSSSDTETFSNVLLLEGPSGSGKTAAVYACAEESGFSVCEIHPGQRRSGKDVLAALEDVILSHTISVPAGAPDVTAATAVNQVLILIEQVDVLFEQDLRLWPALKQLALKSRRPIVLTCTDSTCVRWESFSFHSVLRFSRPSENLLVPYCFFLCLVEGTLVSLADLGTVCREAGCDLNRMLCALEVVTRQAATQKSELSGSTDDACDPAISPPPLVSSVSIDLGGTMAWLFNPLEPGETPETRHRFWVDLITSVQPADDTSNWFRLWPDPPPSFETPSTQAKLF
ncbi:hypothetical protein GGI07_001556 [Coemansia sp. Benny D115]|nr:hypothetical protein GGI07_001556 [Coemansia sp. Benny D115]